MARATVAQLQMENNNLRLENHQHHRDAADHKQDFMTLEKSYEAEMERRQLVEKELFSYKEKLETQVEATTKLQKEHDSHKNMREHFSREHDKVVLELESVHAVLDSVENAPPRSYDNPENGGYPSQLKRSTVTRLAGAFLAIARGAK